MKTYDRHEIKKGRVYYIINMPSPFLFKHNINKARCRKIRWWGSSPIFEFSLSPGSISLLPSESRRQVFRSFEKAKEVCIKKAKAIKKEADDELARLEILTKKDLKK